VQVEHAPNKEEGRRNAHEAQFMMQAVVMQAVVMQEESAGKQLGVRATPNKEVAC